MVVSPCELKQESNLKESRTTSGLSALLLERLYKEDSRIMEQEKGQAGHCRGIAVSGKA